VRLGSDEFDGLIKQSAALRGGKDFAGAIALIESRLAELDPDCLLNAYLECFHAARESGLREKATEYAHKLAAIAPQIPSVKAFLSARQT
jgi:hypothetical protein